MNAFPSRTTCHTALLAAFTLLPLSHARPAVAADDPSPTATATFDGAKRPGNWGVNFGTWEPVEGVLVGRERKEDNHAAASRWRIPMSDGIITLKIRFQDGKAFHVGFDPAPGELDKKGHLYSLVVTPTGASIKKHRDKADKNSQDETLATASGPLPPSEWINIRLETRGDAVTATVGDQLTLSASDPSFHVKKPTIVFRVIGGAVEIDEVNVTVLEASTKTSKPSERAAGE